MRIAVWMTSVLVAVALGHAASARAQQVDGQVTVPPPPPSASSSGLSAPPPNYQQTYGQSVYGQPAYGQPYAQPQPYGQPYAGPQHYPQPYQLQPQAERTESLRPLWISGAVLLPVSYVLTAVTATATLYCGPGSTCRDPDYVFFSWVPLVGPWFMLAQNDPRPLNAGEIIGALAGGVAQLAGLTMIIVGASVRQPVDGRSGRASTTLERGPELRLGLAPTLGGGQLTATLTHF